MSLSDLTDQILNWLVIYGPPVFALTLFLGGIGIPLPGTFFVLAMGAFVRQGIMEWPLPLLLGLGAVVVGDTLSYGLGRFARKGVLDRFLSGDSWEKADAFFNKRGGSAIYLTRWLLTPIALPTNLIAGSSGYPLRRFLLFDISGEITWLVAFGLLGYVFGSSWELVSSFVSDFSGVLVGVVVLGLGVYFAVRHWHAPEPEVEVIHP